MSEDATRVEREIAVARERVRHATTELGDTVKRKTDVGAMAGEHPWIALGAAVALGALVGGTGAERKAASAVGAAGAAGIAKVKALRSSDDAGDAGDASGSDDDTDAAASALAASDAEREELSGPSFGDRLLAAAALPFRSGFERLMDDMRSAALNVGRDLGQWSTGRRTLGDEHVLNSAAGSPARVDRRPMAPLAPLPPLAGSDSEGVEGAVPVPREMQPVELEARADAVEGATR